MGVGAASAACIVTTTAAVFVMFFYFASMHARACAELCKWLTYTQGHQWCESVLVAVTNRV